MGSPPTVLPVVVERRIEHRVTGVRARTDRRSLETIGPNATGSRQSHWGDRTQGSRHARKPPEASGLAKHVTREVCHDIENKSSGRRSTSQGENANGAVSPPA